jgi:hypothetical protein
VLTRRYTIARLPPWMPGGVTTKVYTKRSIGARNA